MIKNKPANGFSYTLARGDFYWNIYPQKRRRYDGMGLVVGNAQRVSIKDQIFLLLVFQRIRVSINTVNRRALLHTIFEVFCIKIGNNKMKKCHKVV